MTTRRPRRVSERRRAGPPQATRHFPPVVRCDARHPPIRTPGTGDCGRSARGADCRVVPARRGRDGARAAGQGSRARQDRVARARPVARAGPAASHLELTLGVTVRSGQSSTLGKDQRERERVPACQALSEAADIGNVTRAATIQYSAKHLVGSRSERSRTSAPSNLPAVSIGLCERRRTSALACDRRRNVADPAH